MNYEYCTNCDSLVPMYFETHGSMGAWHCQMCDRMLHVEHDTIEDYLDQVDDDDDIDLLI